MENYNKIKNELYESYVIIKDKKRKRMEGYKV